MHPYRLPRGMRYASLSEREQFYSQEFDLRRVKEWLEPLETTGRVAFAVIMGRHTRIFRPEYAEDAATTILIENYEDLKDVRAQILEFLPEAVYYDRNIYEKDGKVIGQELAFDLDPENLTCPVHGTLEDKMKRQQGLGFCKIELKMVEKETAKLYERLQSLFSELKIVYSGRGFHIHVLDKEVFGWKRQIRSALAKKLTKEGFLIDEWVTSGGMRLIRLPYSLHGMVSRKALPITMDELPGFDPVTDERCLPEFLKP
ncbi:MAG TPA: DNA primase [Candidatus Bathyarchaeia archaeon]|nr:DNA primase [Candidatus Bathyarchaeia archaeon]